MLDPCELGSGSGKTRTGCSDWIDGLADRSPIGSRSSDLSSGAPRACLLKRTAANSPGAPTARNEKGDAIPPDGI